MDSRIEPLVDKIYHSGHIVLTLTPDALLTNLYDITSHVRIEILDSASIIIIPNGRVETTDNALLFFAGEEPIPPEWQPEHVVEIKTADDFIIWRNPLFTKL